jgi:hypothetical protein
MFHVFTYQRVFDALFFQFLGLLLNLSPACRFRIFTRNDDLRAVVCFSMPGFTWVLHQCHVLIK